MTGTMKGSGVEWIGEIPEEWETKKLKYCSSLVIDKVSADSENNEDLMFIGMEHVESQKGCFESSYEPIYDFQGEGMRFAKGDVLFGKLRPYLAKVLLAKDKGKCSPEFFVLRAQPNIVPDFLKFGILSKGFIDYVDSTTFGVKMPRADWELVGNTRFMSPDASKQLQIASFLNEKCAEIDAVIAAKQQQNELLKKQRQSIIYETVTKGLDASVKYKDSGEESIGEIPIHWKVQRLKYLCDIIKTGTTPSTQELQYFGGKLNWYTPSDFTEAFDLIDANRKLEYLAVEENEVVLFPAGTIMIVGIGATTGKIGYLVNEGSCNQQITGMVIKKEFVSKYFMYWLYVNVDYIKSLASFSTLPILNNQVISNLLCIVPPFEEQYHIVRFLESKCVEIASVISCNESIIAKLKDYRQSIIYEAVTGKIAV